MSRNFRKTFTALLFVMRDEELAKRTTELLMQNVKDFEQSVEDMKTFRRGGCGGTRFFLNTEPKQQWLDFLQCRQVHHIAIEKFELKGEDEDKIKLAESLEVYPWPVTVY